MRHMVDLVIPVKPLHSAKTRLRGAAAEHAGLVLAMLLDTVTAATKAGRVLVITSDAEVRAAVRELGAECAGEGAGTGLNAALRHGESLLRKDNPRATVAALQGDLPALRAEDLAGALAEANGRRAFCADRHGTGTSLLISAPGAPLHPSFGLGSAAAHAASGAVPLSGEWPSLRCDVDTAADLDTATTLGLGSHTSALLCPVR